MLRLALVSVLVLALPDSFAPPAVTDLTATAISSTTIQVKWTASSDDPSGGATVLPTAAATYDLRTSLLGPITTDAAFSAATAVAGLPVPAAPGTVEYFLVTGLLPGTTYWFALKVGDEVPNWSALSNSTNATTPGGDVVAPAAVTTLLLTGTTATTASLQWTATGDDGAIGTATSYDVRYSTSAIVTSADFAAATAAIGEPAPGAAGAIETMTLAGLTAGTTYWFAMKVADEVPNWSGMSNVVTGATTPVADTIAPAPITDLAVLGSTVSSVDLRWTATGDDGLAGTATTYDVRYSGSPIVTDADFAAAFNVAGEPACAAAGTVQSMTVPTLVPGMTYWFAIKVGDEVNNWSAVSNSPAGTTLSVSIPDVKRPPKHRTCGGSAGAATGSLGLLALVLLAVAWMRRP